MWSCVAGLVAVLATGVAVAEEPDADLDVLFGFRGVGEVWQDAAVVENYRASRFSGAGFVSYGLNRWLSTEMELGYMRTLSESGRTLLNEQGEPYAQVAEGALELVPITLGLTATRDLGNAEAFWGGGFAMAVFTERTSAGTIGGAKPGFDLRTGIRIHTDFVQPRMRPHGSTGAQGIDLELMLGRRQHHAFGVGTGFDFSAWRVGAGVVARF